MVSPLSNPPPKINTCNLLHDRGEPARVFLIAKIIHQDSNYNPALKKHHSSSTLTGTFLVITWFFISSIILLSSFKSFHIIFYAYSIVYSSCVFPGLSHALSVPLMIPRGHWWCFRFALCTCSRKSKPSVVITRKKWLQLIEASELFHSLSNLPVWKVSFTFPPDFSLSSMTSGKSNQHAIHLNTVSGKVRHACLLMSSWLCWFGGTLWEVQLPVFSRKQSPNWSLLSTDPLYSQCPAVQHPRNISDH